MATEIQHFPLLSSSYMEKLRWLRNPSHLVWVIIGFGVVARLVQYLSNRSIWLDEAYLALNLVQKSYLELLAPLDLEQAAPLGFLLLEKVLLNTFGDSEYVLRLFPFVAGILSLFLFYSVAKRVLSQSGLIIALVLFATSEPLLYYSSELKQYSSDVAIALGVVLLGLVWTEKESKLLVNTVIFSIIGSVLIWFSHPSIFCLAGVGLSLTIHSLKTKNWKQLACLGVLAICWLSSFAINAYVSLLELSQAEHFVRGWGSNFVPLVPLSARDLMWYPIKFFKMFTYPGGFSLNGIAAFCFVIGCVSKFLENRQYFFMLIMPAMMALVASGLHKYPFEGRLILFLVPMIMIFIGEGVGRVLEQRNHTVSIIGVILCGFLFFQPVPKAIGHLWNPIKKEEVRPIMKHLQREYQEGDVVYLYYLTWPAFDYYATRYGFGDVERLQGVRSRGNWPNYVNDLNSLKGNERVWVLFSHVDKGNGVDEEQFFLHVLDGMGHQVDSLKHPGASIYLYDLN